MKRKKAKLEGCGYTGKILFIDLSKQKSKIWETEEKIAHLFLGGKGLGAYLLYQQTPPKIDPLSSDNVLIIVTGPLTGTTAPTSGKFGIVTKSPATGGFLDAYCGGFFAQNLKYAGYDAVVICGVAEKPSLIYIEDDTVEILPCETVWGAKTLQTNIRLKEKLGNGFATLVIGPAGERKAPIAGIFADTRCAGRGGAGAVMGSKNLKAVVVKGTGGVKAAIPSLFQKAVWTTLRNLRMSSAIWRLREEGTVNILELINASGGLPTRNFKMSQFDKATDLFSEKWKEEIWQRSIACFSCPISCSKITKKIKRARIDGPDYETIFSLGPNCGVSDKQAIVYANYLCDMYGVDTISVGGIIAYVFELFEKKILTKVDLDGITPRWGDGVSLIKLTEKICRGEGVGKILQYGVKRLSEMLIAKEPDILSFTMQVKGLEMPAYHPNAAKGIALAYAVSERGACHLHGAPLGELLGTTDPLTYQGKAELFKIKQTEIAVVNSAIICYFAFFGMTLKGLYRLLSPATGFKWERVADLAKIGERIINLTRIYNIREGFKRSDDTLPDRCLKEPIPNGPAKGEVVELEHLREEYYQLMGWDKEGIPQEERLKELKMEEFKDAGGS